MSWADYHLDDPTFCKPMIVAEGLLRALFERQRASYIAQYGGGWDWTLDEYRDRIFPDIFTKTDVLSVKTFCRNFDGYLALFAWTNINIYNVFIFSEHRYVRQYIQRCQHHDKTGSPRVFPVFFDWSFSTVIIPVEFLFIFIVFALESPNLRCGASIPVLRFGRFNLRLFRLCGLLFDLNRSVLFEIVRRSRLVGRNGFPNPGERERALILSERAVGF